MGLSVQIDRLNVGPYQLDSQKIPPLLKRKAELCLSNFISNRSPNLGGKELSFCLKMDVQIPTLQLGERRIVVENGAELEPIKKLYRYHQHTGHLPRTGMSPREEEIRDKATQKIIVDMNRDAIPGTNGHILAGMRLAEDTLSVTRNFLFAIPMVGPEDPIVNHLGYYAGMFWTFFAIRELDGGITELKRSKIVGDGEGERRAAARIASGAICTTASFAYLSGKIFDSFVSAPLASGFLDASNVLFGIGSLLAMGSSSLGAYRCYRFNERLNEYLENKNLTQVEKLRGALQFLKDAVSVTPEEKAQLQTEIEKSHPEWTPEQKEKLLQQKISDLTETKVKHLKRRTSHLSLHLILTQANALLDKLNSLETQAEGIKDATIMLDTIQRENKAKMALYILGFIAALISFAAMCVMTFLSAGALPFVLYGIAGTIYLAISIYNVSGMITKKDPDSLKNLDLHPLQDMGPLEPQHISF